MIHWRRHISGSWAASYPDWSGTPEWYARVYYDKQKHWWCWDMRLRDREKPRFVGTQFDSASDAQESAEETLQARGYLK